jgi:hypothetical protein
MDSENESSMEKKYPGPAAFLVKILGFMTQEEISPIELEGFSNFTYKISKSPDFKGRKGVKYTFL